MQKYLKKTDTKLKLRQAKIEDLYFILMLHNQNVIEKKFSSKKKVKIKDHKIWFTNKRKEKMLFIGLLNKKIGYVRYDYLSKKCLSVSIAVIKKYKRKGFGKQMILKTLNKKKISKFDVIANIEKQNLASKKFFSKLGFKLIKKNRYLLKARV